MERGARAYARAEDGESFEQGALLLSQARAGARLGGLAFTVRCAQGNARIDARGPSGVPN